MTRQYTCFQRTTGILLSGMFICLLAFLLSADAHQDHDTGISENKAADSGSGPPKDEGVPLKGLRKEPAPPEIGIIEKLGERIPLDIGFVDEHDSALVLKDFINRPTLILPVFYHCPQSCSTLLSNLVDALNNVPYPPGDAYRVLTVSFDAGETPAHALTARKNYLKPLRSDFPEHEWRFLTGSRESIQTLLNGMGYQIARQGPGAFTHPNVLICVASDGKIIRYLYGPYFLPFDTSMAIAEAEKGTPGVSIKKLISYCFAYDPASRKYVFKTFRISGFLILGFLAVFILFLIRKKDKSATGTD